MNDLMTKSFLSYVELKKQARKDESESDIEKGEFKFTPHEEQNLSGFFQEIESIKTQIEEITHLLLDLQTLNEESKSTHSTKILRGLRDRMESNIVTISRKTNTIKTHLESLENQNSDSKAGSCENRARISITNGIRSKLRETMSEFHRLRERIFADYKEDLKRKYFLATGEEASNLEMEKMIRDSSGSGLKMKGEIDSKVKERYEEVNEIKRSLNRLHQVFLDMAVLVEKQGDKVDDIEANVMNAETYVNGGTGNLQYVMMMKKKNRKNWIVWIAILSVVVVLVCLISMIASR